jgi:hypothetical protein
MNTAKAPAPTGHDEGKARTAPAADAGPLAPLADPAFRAALDALESERLAILRGLRNQVAIVAVLLGGAALFAASTGRVPAPDIAIGIIFVLSLIPAGWLSVRYQTYRNAFKRRGVAAMLAATHPGLRFWPQGRFGMADIRASGLFPSGEVNWAHGEDFGVGRVGATAFRFCEITVGWLQPGKVNLGRQGQRFRGLYLRADFNKHFRSRAIVLPDRAEALAGELGRRLQALRAPVGELIRLEDPEFERLFAVYADDPVEVRYLLSAALMARIKDLRLRHGSAMRLSFAGSHLHVAIAMGRNLFEPRLFGAADAPALYREFWDDIKFITGIIEDLNLNTRIWTRD